MRDNKYGEIDFPLRGIPDHEMEDFLAPLKESLGDTVTMEELKKGVKLAKSMRFSTGYPALLIPHQWNIPSI